ncbi:MAG: hypothetical protein ACFFFC_10800 [Candidatus Thorarchaeota archaeon]
MLDDPEDDVVGHYSSNRSNSIRSNLIADSGQTADGIWYAYWEDNRQEDEDE